MPPQSAVSDQLTALHDLTTRLLTTWHHEPRVNTQQRMMAACPQEGWRGENGKDAELKGQMLEGGEPYPSTHKTFV